MFKALEILPEMIVFGDNIYEDTSQVKKRTTFCKEG